MERHYEVPNKLEARNFDELRVLMLATNVRMGGKVLYDIHPPRNSKDRWYAFYYEKMSAEGMLREQLKQTKKNK